MSDNVDSYTLKVFETLQQRSKALGLKNKAKCPLSENNHLEETSTSSNATAAATTTTSTTLTKSRKSPSPTKRASSSKARNEQRSSSPRKVYHHIDMSDSKENVDLALEINITTGPNCNVQVEVEEQDIDAQGNVIRRHDSKKDTSSANSASIRDSSKNMLQRLGALYSDSENLSSPIHHNESRFDVETDSSDSARPQPIKKFGKLAALANSINNWEDDLSHLDVKVSAKQQKDERRSPTKSYEPRIIDTSPRKQQYSTETVAPKATTSILSVRKKSKDNSGADDKIPSKQLKWDKSVMDALEMQGFERRVSTAPKLVYDYGKDSSNESNCQEEKLVEPSTSQKITPVVQKSVKPSTPAVVATTTTPKEVTTTKGFVSGRAAIFENSNKSSVSKFSKDPAELSIKERLAIFEQNKGTALIPKAPFAMSVSTKQISNEASTNKKPSKFLSTQQQVQQTQSATVQQQQGQLSPKISSYNKPSYAKTTAGGNCIRNTVANLLSNTTTIAESQISADTRKQREKEMNVLLNRFNTKSSTESETEPPVKQMNVPPPAPPMPPPNFYSPRTQPEHVDAKCLVKTKRKSGDKLDLAAKKKEKANKDESKRMKTNPNRLYPVLSDIESTTATESDTENNCTTATLSDDEDDEKAPLQHHTTQKQYYHNQDADDSYMDSDVSDDICNISLGREIMQAVANNDSHATSFVKHTPSYNNSKQHQQPPVFFDSSAADSETSAVDEMDNYLDEALEDDDEEYDEENDDAKSNSFSYQKSPKQFRQQNIIQEDSDENNQEHETKSVNFRTPVKSHLTINPSDDNNMVTLTHTVSFYRRQQSQSANVTPLRKVTYSDNRSSKLEYAVDDPATTSDTEPEQREKDMYAMVQEKVNRLHDEVRKQEQIISQTSRLLNHCAATVEFSGSTESVEGERHLLVATHRRKAALDEIQRLSVERCIRPANAPQDRGRLTVKEITVPLRNDYVDKMAADTSCGHQLVCLLKYNENVVATKTVPTLPGLMSVKFPDILQLNNVYADFKITLEIYGMKAQPEILPHDIKYHINKKPLKGRKGHDSKILMLPVQSPGGPDAVRTPALSFYGFVIFSIREVQRDTWTLNQMSGVSPLKGIVQMKVNCELNVSIYYKGFLSMFEDVAGFGAWHRRWCKLNGYMLTYWRFPDDEKKKQPIGSIDLNNCCSKEVAVAPLEIRAGKNHTLLFETKRIRQKDDADSLVITKQGNYAIVRHLLSADTKEEQQKWCAHLNKSLISLRLWRSSNKK